jgi:hypothetical protein
MAAQRRSTRSGGCLDRFGLATPDCRPRQPHWLAARSYSSANISLNVDGQHRQRRFRSVDGRPCLWLGKGAAEVLGPLLQGDCPARACVVARAGFTRASRETVRRYAERCCRRRPFNASAATVSGVGVGLCVPVAIRKVRWKRMKNRSFISAS